MEYVDGATLSALRVERPNEDFQGGGDQPFDNAVLSCAEICAPQRSLVHRDLKLANLMVNAKKVQLKITDFGIARSLSDSVSMLTMRATSGTLVYMSPQQFDGERPSSLDDIYSFGATLYEMLTSKPPFFSGAIKTQVRDKTPVSIAARRKVEYRQRLTSFPRSMGGNDREMSRQRSDAAASEVPGRLAACPGLAPRPIESAPRHRPIVNSAEQSGRRQQPYCRRRSEPIVLTPISRPALSPLPLRRVVAWSLAALLPYSVSRPCAVGWKSVRGLVADISNQEPTPGMGRSVPLER